jgi:hypothetical protein
MVIRFSDSHSSAATKAGAMTPENPVPARDFATITASNERSANNVLSALFLQSIGGEQRIDLDVVSQPSTLGRLISVHGHDDENRRCTASPVSHV